MARDHRKHIEEAAKRALKDHTMSVKGVASVEKRAMHDPKQTMQELGAYVWLCRSADKATWAHWYYVAELPGAIVQYGDVGGLLIEQGRAYDLKWLEGAMGSLDYVLSKSKAKRDTFIEDDFKAYLVEHDKDPDDYECYEDYALQTGDTEAYECCHDWSADTLWAYWALWKFVELRRAR
jgi:hypothetical protein